MNYDPLFADAAVAHQHNATARAGAEYPADLVEVLGAGDQARARAAVTGWDGYAPSPLLRLDQLAREIGVGNLWYKDEGGRFGLGSFKALGGAYAVLRLLAAELPARIGGPVTDADIESRRYLEAAAGITVVTATDGNHGRSVAWGARRFGCPCRVYMHASVSPGRAHAVEALGATVVHVDGNYDESIHRAADDAAANGWFVVSDTSYEDYTEIPRQVMAGYSVMTSEIIEQLSDGTVPSHVFVQGGVGGLAAAVCSHFWQEWGPRRPRLVVVEPDRAACLYSSAVAGRPTTVTIEEETVMAGLSCGEVSYLGWQILGAGADDFLTIPDQLVAPIMRRLADGGGDPPIVAGETAVAGIAALLAARRSDTLSGALGLDGASHVLAIGTEGATDPDIYQSIVGVSPGQVRDSALSQEDV